MYFRWACRRTATHPPCCIAVDTVNTRTMRSVGNARRYTMDGQHVSTSYLLATTLHPEELLSRRAPMSADAAWGMLWEFKHGNKKNAPSVSGSRSRARSCLVASVDRNSDRKGRRGREAIDKREDSEVRSRLPLVGVEINVCVTAGTIFCAR